MKPGRELPNKSTGTNLLLMNGTSKIHRRMPEMPLIKLNVLPRPENKLRVTEPVS
jgi:hypothetical protein